MAVYVLMQFKDEDQAKTFVEQRLVAQSRDHGDGNSDVVGVWKKPTVFCTCSDGGKRTGGYTRGKKYGWWIHAACGKPTRGWSSGKGGLYEFGINLLPNKLIPEDAQPVPEDWRSEIEWKFLLSEG